MNRPDGSKKDTVLNIEQNGQFVINVVSHAIAEKMNLTSGDFGFEENEFEIAGLTTVDSLKVKPPCVKESAAQFECELIQIVKVGDGPLAANLIIGKILHLHIADEVLDQRGRVDSQRLDNVGRLGGEISRPG